MTHRAAPPEVDLPGSVPAARLDRRRQAQAVHHDIATGTGFTIFTGIIGRPWAEAAVELATELGIELKAVVIGEGEQHQDLYGDWLHQREVGEDGVILVRPDKHIGWRAHHLVAGPKQALAAVLTSILSRGAEEKLTDAQLAELSNTAALLK